MARPSVNAVLVSVNGLAVCTATSDALGLGAAIAPALDAGGVETDGLEDVPVGEAPAVSASELLPDAGFEGLAAPGVAVPGGAPDEVAMGAMSEAGTLVGLLALPAFEQPAITTISPARATARRLLTRPLSRAPGEAGDERRSPSNHASEGQELRVRSSPWHAQD
jgi:hypothetical protein